MRYENRLAHVRSLLLMLLLVSSTLSLNFLTTANGAEPLPKYGGTLITPITNDPAVLNPAIDTGVYSSFVGGQMLEGLCEYAFGMIPRPRLAESWEISSDGLTYTFHLRQNVTWHDGQPFTSADVKFTYENVLSKYQARVMASLQKCLKSVDTPDDYTAIFNLNFSFAPLISCLSGAEGAILPKHLYEGTDILTNEYNAKPVGTGPFKFKEWVKGSHIIVEKNENYWRKGYPYLDRVIFQVVPDSAARMLAFDKGELDYLWYTALPESEVGRLQTVPGVTVTDKASGWGTPNIQIWVNLRRPILSNVKVRQAIYYAIDRDTINTIVSYGLFRPATGPIPYDHWSYNPNVTKYAQDLAKANTLLDEAGYPRGTDGVRFELGLIHQIGTIVYEKSCEVIKSQLAEVGIKINLQALERNTMIDTTMVRWDFDLWLHGTGTGPDPAMGVACYYYSYNIKPMAWVNAVGYNNSQVDWLLEQAERAPDMEQRKQYYYEFQEIVVNDLPYLYILDRPAYSAFKNEFVGLHAWSAYGYVDLYDVWWTGGTAWSVCDINEDGAINILDISRVAKAFGSGSGDPSWDPMCDLDSNNAVNILDIAKVAKDFGKRAPWL